MSQIEDILEKARSYLTTGWSAGKGSLRTMPRNAPDLIWDHSRRTLRLAHRLMDDPTIEAHRLDDVVLTTAAVFHDACWVDLVKTGRIAPPEVFSRPADAELLKHSAQIACDQVGKDLPERTMEKVVRTITEFKLPRPSLTESVLLGDADNLEDFGVLGFTFLVRSAQALGKSTGQLVESWRRQQEYHYWEARIKNAFHLETARELARRRLETMGTIFELLHQEINSEKADEDEPDRHPNMARG